MKRFKQLALVAALATLGIGATANAATTAVEFAHEQITGHGFMAAADLATSDFTSSNFYVGAGVVQTMTGNFYPFVNGIGNKTTSYKGYGGWLINEFAALEIGVVDLGKLMNAASSPMGSQATLNLTALNASVIGRLPLTLLGPTIPYIRDLTPIAKLGYATGNMGSGLSYGLGVEYLVANHWSVRIETERFTNQGQPYIFYQTSAGIPATAALTSVGVQYRF